MMLQSALKICPGTATPSQPLTCWTSARPFRTKPLLTSPHVPSIVAKTGCRTPFSPPSSSSRVPSRHFSFRLPLTSFVGLRPSCPHHPRHPLRNSLHTRRWSTTLSAAVVLKRVAAKNPTRQKRQTNLTRFQKSRSARSNAVTVKKRALLREQGPLFSFQWPLHTYTRVFFLQSRTKSCYNARSFSCVGRRIVINNRALNHPNATNCPRDTAMRSAPVKQKAKPNGYSQTSEGGRKDRWSL